MKIQTTTQLAVQAGKIGQENSKLTSGNPAYNPVAGPEDPFGAVIADCNNFLREKVQPRYTKNITLTPESVRGMGESAASILKLKIPPTQPLTPQKAFAYLTDPLIKAFSKQIVDVTPLSGIKLMGLPLGQLLAAILSILMKKSVNKAVKQLFSEESSPAAALVDVYLKVKE